MKTKLPIAALALLAHVAAAPAVHAQAAAAQSAGRTAASPLAPSEIVAAAPAGDWRAIAAADLLVMTLAPDARGPSTGSGSRRVVIQLMPPPLSQGWVGNIRKLAAAHWWDGLSVNRVQDNYVAQWGDADGDDKAKARALPTGLAVVPESEYASTVDQVGEAHALTVPKPTSDISLRAAQAEALVAASEAESRRDENGLIAMQDTRTPKAPNGWHDRDSYAEWVEVYGGWPLASDRKAMWPVHCYGMVGVGRDLSPNTGTGAELYTVIGHAPRHLDRNIALVGRVIEGIEHLSSLPRGTEALGFYKTAAERTPIASIRLGGEVADLPRYEYLSTESGSFARYADARANRRDAFFIRPAGGADICNIPVPVRRVK